MYKRRINKYLESGKRGRGRSQRIFSLIQLGAVIIKNYEVKGEISLKKDQLLPWLVWLNGLSNGLQTKGLLV